MADFEKGHKKLGGRRKGTPNKASESIKALLSRILDEVTLEKMWRAALTSKDKHIRMKAFEMAHRYLYGKPVQPVVGEELAAPIKIDVSAIPKFRVPLAKLP